MGYHFTDEKGSFFIEKPEQSTGIYMPLVNMAGVMGDITPTGHGDSKLSQENFLLEPVSAENLHSQPASRNFWCCVEGEEPWSVFGQSVKQEALRDTDKKDISQMEAGAFWQKTKRTSRVHGLTAEVLSFCPTEQERVEIMKVTLRNDGSRDLVIHPVAAVRMYGRSADNIRDHRHVTSLLNRMKITEDGVVLTPAMSFDERGHQRNEMSYSVLVRRGDGVRPIGVIPTVEEFIGEGGSLLWPRALMNIYEGKDGLWKKPGEFAEGYECIAGVRFEKMTLKCKESCDFYMILSYMEEGMEYLEPNRVDTAFESMKQCWENRKIMQCKTGDLDFDRWIQWVSLQPDLRRIFGCSFLPHHDYGRGGRGWRDLWQDCLALLLKNPSDVKQDLIQFFAGIRTDGSNATIIGSKAGTFKADRNEITRLWMDHGYWPYRTVRLYLDITGDTEILFHKNTYFMGQSYQGTVLEHLLVQHLSRFYDVGSHGHMRLHGADWNDALDMAGENGESVAFTAAYSGNLKDLSDLLLHIAMESGREEVELAEELRCLLLVKEERYDNFSERQEVFHRFCRKGQGGFGGNTWHIKTKQLAEILCGMGEWIQKHIRRMEIVKDGKENIWFNGYYDNHGEQVEGVFEGNIRMMLTGQVFTILSGTATDEQVEKIVQTANRCLYQNQLGGYRLNTNFHEVKLDLGRMFGFAYGHKENGAVFCHMAVMYAFALYQRHFAREGYEVIKSLYEQCMDFETARIYPGIPEYFNEKGRGMYPWLTGAASWLLLTLLTQSFGVRGQYGSLFINPQLLAEQFNEEGNAEITFSFAGKKMQLNYRNRKHLEVGDYEVAEIRLDGEEQIFDKKKPVILLETLQKLSDNETHKLSVTLE